MITSHKTKLSRAPISKPHTANGLRWSSGVSRCGKLTTSLLTRSILRWEEIGRECAFLNARKRLLLQLATRTWRPGTSGLSGLEHVTEIARRLIMAPVATGIRSALVHHRTAVLFFRTASLRCAGAQCSRA